MARMRGAVVMALALTALPAAASNSFTIYCEDGSFRQLVREGNQEREWMRGLGKLPLWCPATARLQNHPVGLEGEAFTALLAIAAVDQPDTARVGDHFAWRDDDTPLGEATRNAIGWEKQGTFGQLRATLKQLAVPTGQYVGETGFRSYRSAACPEPLIPLRYYLNAKAPFPGCGGGRLLKADDDLSYFD